MDAEHQGRVFRGVVLPLLASIVIVAAAVALDENLVFAGMLAAIPLTAAFVAPRGMTILVGVIALAEAAALVALAGFPAIGAAPVAAVVVFGALAVLLGPDTGREGPSEPPPAIGTGRSPRSLHLQTQADVDPLTGLLNRRGALRALGPRNDGGEMLVAFVDCDTYAQVNADFGTHIADEYLQAVAGRLRHRFPSHDIVARWDGDEFLLGISAAAEAARPVLGRVLELFEGRDIRTTAGPVPAGVSVGAALWKPGQDVEGVVARAGKALYSAKSMGGGHLVVDGNRDG